VPTWGDLTGYTWGDLTGYTWADLDGLPGPAPRRDASPNLRAAFLRLGRRSRLAQPVPTQVSQPQAPAYPFAAIGRRQQRASPARRVQQFTAPAIAAGPPQQVAQPHRVRAVPARRGRSFAPRFDQPVQGAPLATGHRRPLAALLRSHRPCLTVLSAAPPPVPPAWPISTPTRRRPVAALRRGSVGDWWPAQTAACSTPRPSSGTTARPSSGTTTYATATTARPSTGITARPDTGQTEDPC
jgi:hypothetical protein